jgi:hypothetical protein
MAHWYETQARLKPDKVVVKLRDNDGRFMQSIIIPTVMYPLNGPYQVFHAGNTVRTEDPDMLAVIDTVRYQIGHCYTNTKHVVDALRKAGFDAVSYAGWLFVGEQTPIHHCWAVVNGKVIVDLCDDYPMQKVVCPNIDQLHGDEVKQAAADFIRGSRHWPNSVRCCPIGQPTPWFYYVGCPCEPNAAAQIWMKLIKDYPNHECRRDQFPESRSETQQYLHEQGLM